ncbi:MAG: cytochrome b [Porticoccaceae bacterium]
MKMHNSSERYASTLIVLHWLMLALIVAVYACIELRVLFPKGSDPREALKTWHFMLGLSVLLLAVLRVVVRIAAGAAPPIVPTPKTWQQVLAKTVHFTLYALMLGMPLIGWLILSTSGKPIPFFGLELPSLMGENKALSSQAKSIHEAVGIAGYFLIAFHAAAALLHQYFVRDNTLMRMLPHRKQD